MNTTPRTRSRRAAPAAESPEADVAGTVAKVATPSGRERRQRVQSAELGMAVLKALARLGGAATLTALAAEVDESPAKVHRYLVSLVEEGLVVQDSHSPRYQLGIEAMLIGLAAMRQADPVRLAEPALLRLRESLEVTCFVAVMGNKGATIVRFEEPGLPVTVNVRVGSVLSLVGSATGRLFLALADDSRVRALADDDLAHASHEWRAAFQSEFGQGGDPLDALRTTVLEDLARHGCVCVRDTNLKGISAVAAPLFDYTGRVRAAITALGATGGFDASPEGPVARAVRDEARAISTALGFREKSRETSGKPSPAA